MPPHWTTRPKEPKEIDPREITRRIFEYGEPIYCGKCGEQLKLRQDPKLIKCCEQCDKDGRLNNFTSKVGAYRIIGSKIYLDVICGEFQEGKSLRAVIR